MKIHHIGLIFAMLLLAGIVFATITSIGVQSCAFISGSGTIHNCAGLNSLDVNTSDVTVGKNAIFAATMFDVNGTLGTIHDVKVTFNHSGVPGISGKIGVTFFDQNSSSAFCTEDQNISNVAWPVFKVDSVTACTPSGGWTQTKLNNLEMRFANYDTGTAQRLWLDYVVVDINHS